MTLTRFGLSLLLLIGALLPAYANDIESVRVWPSPNNTRIVFDLGSQPDYSYFTLKNPDRVVIDFAETSLSVDLGRVDNTNAFLKRIRTSTPKNKRATRVVLDLSRSVTPELFAMPPTKPYGHRLVVDLPYSPMQAPQVVVKSSEQSDRDRDIIIAIDAGHGGEDPGSVGPTGTFEKNIVLSIAKKLQAMVDNEPGMRAVMTRTGDYYIAPNRRPELARQHKADLLVSIHADAFTTPQPRGGSVWVLSTGRADSELGRWMERTERHSELLGGAAEVINDAVSERYLAETILGLSMDHSMATSHDLSQKVISEMRKITKMHKTRPQAASLAVLTSPDIPSILVEVGFISNPQEEKNLNWAEHRERLATSMFNATKRYFKAVPPDGTLWASLKNSTRTHKVRSGESLSVLAQRYNVNVSSLKQANNLTSDVVRIGQVLTIP
ncbi:N-acetylmuramoyl-L-alanine amidase [Alteromonas oceanisediminis]|uniref:N-acetylmuramoyl-L-alanine amidase n=1 Tax=Alteromonas oceanisediminis TaxID=2836180 RepID=UPI001BDB3998|nr:N-acetylmuramoyl-L-alanine amidase [Alteromonas oceanisediminis]MBT0586932.1 N-acetylmuramoyl-L-alanine amidase [Alteromonas oceanisediminis]